MRRLSGRPHPGTLTAASAACALLAALSTAPARAEVPTGFVDKTVATLQQAVGVAFTSSGLGFVWEKSGRVWLFENGTLAQQPLLDISEEVGNWRDLGLLGLAIDPNFADNGYIYLLYAVDYHHLRYFGTPDYDPQANEYNRDTISRLTRYTCIPGPGGLTVDPASRHVLVGESISTGFPICNDSHSIGTVLFGEDGSLLVGNGDSAGHATYDTGGAPVPGGSYTALADGIISPEEDVGAFRAQLRQSLSGKIIRIDPATGDGLPSNPFYDPAAPRSPQSRVWCMGLRNPFRFTIRPGTGNPDPAAGDPGTLFIGDVGWGGREELNIARTGGLNFGWPLFEGLDVHGGYWNTGIANRHAPNPLFGQGGCTQEFFLFRDLLIQQTLNPPSWPNPCSPGAQIPPSSPRMMHTRPAIEWGHGGPTRVGIFSGGIAQIVDIDHPSSPVQGTHLPPTSNSSCGGVWYKATAFPPEYRDVYFHADFVGGWIAAMRFDASDTLLSVEPFLQHGGGIVCVTVNPADGALYYIAYSETGQAQLRRVSYGEDAPPVAVADATPRYGTVPFAVSFSSEGSHDPDGDSLTYHWEFGDCSPPSAEPNPTHVYAGEFDITAEGTFIARVLELDPPRPTGGGSYDPEILRDDDYPAVGTGDSRRQYDTFHGGQQGTDDWIGWTFDTPRRLSRVVFQEGIHFVDGGWFDTLSVECRVGGQWIPVSGLVISPPYPGNNGVSFETFTLDFAPTVADGVRLRGDPGGSANFLSVAELRVGGVPVDLGDAPRRYDARLTVTDDIGQRTSVTVPISANNSPPAVAILSPADGGFYRMIGVTTVPLAAAITDAEHVEDELACTWQVVLHHADHTHPEPEMPGCSGQVLLTPIGCDGEPYAYEFRLTVTDPLDLSTTVTSFLYPQCCRADWNLDSAVNSADVSAFLADWLTSLNLGNNNADFTGEGSLNSADISAFLESWLNAVTGADPAC